MILKWQGKRVVTLFLTFHNNETETRKNSYGRDLTKPVLVYDYNQNMEVVNVRDQKLHNYILEQKRVLK